jgi:hypothetical protein
MKVRVYSSHCSRPDYIYIQNNSLKKHLKDEYEYIVINDGQNTPSFVNFMNNNCRNDIEQICKELGIQCIPFPQILHQERNKLFPTSKQIAENAAERCADVTQFILQQSLTFEGIVILLDSDMVFGKDVCCNDYMKDLNLVYLPQVRQGVHYMWNGIVIYKPHELPNLSELNFDPGAIPGNPLDAGGMTYLYLEKYKSSLKIKHISSTLQLFPTPEDTISIQIDSIPNLCHILIDSLTNDVPSSSINKFERLDDFIFHYGQGGNWNAKGYGEHMAKTKLFVSYLAASVF